MGRSRDPFLRALLSSGAIRPGPHGLGIDVDAAGAAIGRDGSPTPGLFAIGPLRRGVLWETTAVPEIRVQVRDLASIRRA